VNGVAGRRQSLRRVAPAAAASALLGMLALGTPAEAAVPVGDQLDRIEAQIADQARRLADQDRRLAEQATTIHELSRERDEMLRAMRAAGLVAPEASLNDERGGKRLAQGQPQEPPHAVTELPASPVGEKPATSPAPEVTAIPPDLGVLTPKGRLIIDPSVEYTRSSSTRLVFSGVEVVPGINLGLIEASDVSRDAGVATWAARYGLTNRIDDEARVPYVWRHDRLFLVQRAAPTDIERPQRLDGSGIGDIELSGRYQINSGRGGWPIFVVSERIKAPTGDGPFDVRFDSEAIALSLATGSGFWGAETGITMLYPSEPALIYASLSYLYNFEDNVDKQIGRFHIGRIDPGDSIGLSVGFGLSLNPRFSVSFGYSHNYIFGTETQIDAGKEKSSKLQVGRLQMGWSYRLTDRITLNNSFEFGVTNDAPDLRITIRTPYRF
jgi:hypothetical protein